MRRTLFFLVCLFTFAFPMIARANTIAAGVYSLRNASVGGSSVTGTVTFNSTGNATAADLTYNNAAYSNPGLPYFNQISSTAVYNGISQNYIGSSTNAGQIALYLNTNSNANGSFDLCIGNAQCGTAAGTVDPSSLQIYGFYNSSAGSNPGFGATNLDGGYLSSGTSTSVAATPEPASLLLVGTGLSSLVAAGVRSRSRRTLSMCEG